MSEEKSIDIRQEDIMSLAQANNHLAIRLHLLLAEEEQNVFFSPFSISTAMAMLLCAAEGETASEMRSALGYDHAGIGKENIASIFEQQMSALLKSPESYTLSCANAMLSQTSFDVKQGYKKILAHSFKALLLEVDFQKENQKVVELINEWVQKKTNNMIPELVQSLEPSVVLVLLNAVYFKGTWKKIFEKDWTLTEKFYNKGIEGNAKEIEMMNIVESFPFYEEETLQVFQLPYVGEEVAMLILLPRERDGLRSLESSLTATFFQDLKKKLRNGKLNISLPRFRLEYTKSLVPCFQKLGVGRVFSQGAELGVASDSSDLFVSEILHKAVLEVNEEGSEVTAASLGPVTLGPPEYDGVFVADHPFAFVIYDTRSDLVLFMGRVNEL